MRALTSLLACLVAGLATMAAGQTVAPIHLKILEKGKALPLSKAEVTVNGEKVFSDPQGVAVLAVPASGDGTVVITKKGYERGEIPFAALRPPGDFDAYLIPAVNDDNVVIVRGTRKTAVSRKSISIQEAAKVAPGGDPAQVVKLLPGVQSRNGNQVVVRGSGPRDTKYYIDDLEVPFIFHGFGNLSITPTPILSAVDFEAGGFGPEYGDATGGVITLRTKNEVPERALTQFVVNLPFYSGIYYERPLSEDSGMSVSLRRSYIDLFINQFLKRSKDQVGNVTVSPYFGDGHLTYFKKSESGHVKATLLSAYDGIKAVVPLDASSSEDGRGQFNIYDGFVNIGVEKLERLGKDWKYTTTPQVDYLNGKNNILGNKINDTSLKVRAPTEFTRRLGKGEDLSVGVDPSYQVTKSDYYVIKFVPDDPTWDFEDAEKVALKRTSKATTLAAWTNIDQVFGDTTLSPGVRGYYNSAIKKASADPRLRLKHMLGDANTLKAAYGRYSESPQPRQSSPEFGNSDLDFEHSTHYVLGLEQTWGDDWTTDVEAFYKTAYHIFASDLSTNVDNDGSFKSRGFEVFIRRNLTGRLFGWLSYTYSKTMERKSDREPFHDGRYDQTHVVNAVGSYKLSGTDELGGRYNYHTGDTTTTVTDVIYNANLDKYKGRQDDPDASDARLPNYNALSLYWSHSYLWDSWKLDQRLGIESYWFKPQVQGEFYNYDYSKKRSFTALRAIPFIEVRGEL